MDMRGKEKTAGAGSSSRTGARSCGPAGSWQRLSARCSEWLRTPSRMPACRKAAATLAPISASACATCAALRTPAQQRASVPHAPAAAPAEPCKQPPRCPGTGQTTARQRQSASSSCTSADSSTSTRPAAAACSRSVSSTRHCSGCTSKVSTAAAEPPARGGREGRGARCRRQMGEGRNRSSAAQQCPLCMHPGQFP